jgi:hypothetical protein
MTHTESAVTVMEPPPPKPKPVNRLKQLNDEVAQRRGSGFTPKKASTHHQDVIAAYRAAGLLEHARLEEIDNDMEYAESCGFKRMSFVEAAQLMTGLTYTETPIEGYTTEQFEWLRGFTPPTPKEVAPYQEYLNKMDVFGGGRRVQTSITMKPIGLHTGGEKTPSMVVAPMPALKVRIPYGVLLLTNELKTANVFDCFVAVAPKEMVTLREVPLDPVILGCFAERGDLWWGARITRSYFVAMWNPAEQST